MFVVDELTQLRVD